MVGLTAAMNWLLAISPPVSFAQNTLFTEGFEGAFPGANWLAGDANSGGATAYWDDVDSAFGGEGTAAGNRKGYCAGIGHAGTTNTPFYRDFMIAFMERTVNLTAYPRARLTFSYKIPSVESGLDFARVRMGGATVWSQSAPQSNAWTLASVDLNPFVGGSYTLRFEFSSDNSITREGWYLDEIKLLIPPVNDNFTNATILSGAAGSTNGATILAGLETGETQGVPNMSVLGSVWYRWTAPASNSYAFTVPRFGTNDAAVHVFTGSAVTNLTALGGEFGTPAGSATAAFLARAGSNYWIRVSGFAGGNNTPESNFQLRWNPATNATQRLFATRFGTDVVVSWYALTHRLQASSGFGVDAAWANIPGAPPVTLPATNSNRCFRLVCP